MSSSCIGAGSILHHTEIALCSYQQIEKMQNRGNTVKNSIRSNETMCEGTFNWNRLLNFNQMHDNIANITFNVWKLVPISIRKHSIINTKWKNFIKTVKRRKEINKYKKYNRNQWLAFIFLHGPVPQIVLSNPPGSTSLLLLRPCSSTKFVEF